MQNNANKTVKFNVFVFALSSVAMIATVGIGQPPPTENTAFSAEQIGSSSGNLAQVPSVASLGGGGGRLASASGCFQRHDRFFPF